MQGSNYLSRGIQEAHLWPSWPNSMLSPLHLHKTRTLRWQDWIPSRQLHDSTCQGRHIPWWRQSLLRQDRNWLDHVGLLWLHLPQQGWILARRILNQLFYNFLFDSVRSTKHFLCLEFFSAIKKSLSTNERKKNTVSVNNPLDCSTSSKKMLSRSWAKAAARFRVLSLLYASSIIFYCWNLHS